MAGKMIRNLAIANTKLDLHHFDDVVNPMSGAEASCGGCSLRNDVSVRAFSCGTTLGCLA
jgi:hypothetical protein